jgi:hypothetical protein
MTDQDSKDSTKHLQEQAQTERTERAYAAIHAGSFQITRTSPFQWTVRNGDKLPYVVSLQPLQGATQGEVWSCTCKDFQQRGTDLRCKHIEGVRLSEAAQQQISQQETQMDQTNGNKDESLQDRLDRVLWELRQPLDMTRVKRRQAPGQGTVPYLEGYDVIDRANAIFDFAWSFDLLGEPVVVRWQKKIMAWNQQERRKVPQLDSNGNFQVEDVGIVYATGKVSITLKGSVYSHADLGRCVFSGDTPEALDMALAGSVTDCLKRCFRQLGDQFGNTLYDKEIAQIAGMDQGQTGNTAPPDHHTSTGSKPAAPSRLYSDGTNVNGNVPEQEAYDAYLKKMGKPPASKTDLRNWISANRIPTAA